VKYSTQWLITLAARSGSRFGHGEHELTAAGAGKPWSELAYIYTPSGPSRPFRGRATEPPASERNLTPKVIGLESLHQGPGVAELLQNEVADADVVEKATSTQ
jgi:hypothetical protein